MRIIIFLVLSRYRLACKCVIVFKYQYININILISPYINISLSIYQLFKYQYQLDEFHFLIPGRTTTNQTRLKQKLDSIYFLNKMFLFVY